MKCLPPSAQGAVSQERLHVLSRGANITTAYKAKGDVGPDLRMLSAVGFLHVRVLVDEAETADPVQLAKLDRTIAEAVRLRLGVIICMLSARHPFEPVAGEDSGAADGTEAAWTDAWQILAQRYARQSPCYVFFELANEPKLSEARWSVIQERLLAAIRLFAPKQTVLLTGSPHSMVWSLPKAPSSADNVAYAWHLYQPMPFTHQGADWSALYRPYAGLAYPPDPANIARLRERATPVIREALDRYARDGAAAIGREVAAARDWAADRHVPLVVTEFGAYHVADPRSRARWLAEARRAIEAAGEGWTVWEYQGGFGVTPLLSTAPMMQALGLGQRETRP